MIETYVNDIKQSISNELFFPALSLALTLPDICGSIEFPNKQISERYIGWYDRYIGNHLKEMADNISMDKPYLSGEVVYNLRNTFLHNGHPGVDVKKIKDDGNRINKFYLIVGDNPLFNEVAFTIKDIQCKVILVDVSFLCESICDSALRYYFDNKDKFCFDHKVITSEELLKGEDFLDNVAKLTMGNNWSHVRTLGPSDLK